MTEKRTQGRLWRRLTLSHDGRPVLDRWGFVHDRIGGFYLHHIAGPDPGLDLHDHPWWFVSLVLRGAYHEARMSIRPGDTRRRRFRLRVAGSVAVTRLDEAHRISVVEVGTWTLVLRGPTVRRWGFYIDGSWVDWEAYDYATRRPVRVAKR